MRRLSRFLCILATALIATFATAFPVGAREAQSGLAVTTAEPGGGRPEQGSRPWVVSLQTNQSVRAEIAVLDALSDLAQQLDDAWNAQNWTEVLRLIGEIIALDPAYPEIMDKKYFAHVNYGYELMTQGSCTDALAQFRAALEIKPTGEEAVAGLELLSLYCGTPVPGSGTPGTTPAATATTQPSPIPTSLTPQATALPTSTPAPTILTEPISYTVKAGDTLFSLAKHYGTTVQAIMQANGMMSHFLRAGETVIIPATDHLPAGPIVHIVQPGETLNIIAQRYNTTVWAIMTLNGLRSYQLYAYRALFIPTPVQSGPIIHIVQPGETLYTIATRYGTSVPLLMLANDYDAYDIYVYQRVVIPPTGWTGYPPISIGMGPGPGGSPPMPRPRPPAPQPRRYVVQRGDTLYGIARNYGVTVDAIRRANGLSGSQIYAGTTLIIP